MQISNRTLEVMKNFFSINSSLYYNPKLHGNELITKSVASNIIASVEIEEKFPVEFAIFNLSEFLGSLSLFDKPDLEFSDNFVTVREAGSKRGGLKYFFANPQLITYPQKKPVAPDANYSFSITSEQLQKMERAARTLKVNDLLVMGDEEGVHLIVKDKNQPASNDFEITVSDTPIGEFQYYFKQENWKMLPNDYNVGISVRETDKGFTGIGFFQSTDDLCKYGVAIERV